ncbi:MAG: hypothetical protein R6V49_04775 [Bacteroidales bacterium]
MRKTFLLPMAMIAFVIILFSGCEQDLSKIDTKPAESVLNVMKGFSDIILIVDDGLAPDSAKNGMKIMGPGYTETIEGDYPNKLITWDFGTEGETQGKIKILLNDDYTNPGAFAQITFEDFIYKNKPVDGNINYENLGKTPDDKDEYSFELNQARVDSNELSALWKLQRTVGGLTPEQSDDVFNISQYDQMIASGVTKDGVEFTLNLIEGLVLDLSCEHIITKGIFELLYETTTMKADFGEGDCDNKVVVNNGVVKADIFF